MRIYIAGPYTKPDPVANVRNAILAAEEVIIKGHIPYIPHLTMLWHLVSPHPLEFWYEHDKDWLCYCDIVYRLPGESMGADEEVKLANLKKIRVIYSLEELDE